MVEVSAHLEHVPALDPGYGGIDKSGIKWPGLGLIGGPAEACVRAAEADRGHVPVCRPFVAALDAQDSAPVLVAGIRHIVKCKPVPSHSDFGDQGRAEYVRLRETSGYVAHAQLRYAEARNVGVGAELGDGLIERGKLEGRLDAPAVFGRHDIVRLDN